MDDADPRIGTVLQGRYRVLEALGVGGMGVVYRGERLGLNKPVAIKFLRGDMAVQDEFVVRFEREARAMSQLQHPHLIPVIDFGVVDATPYLVLEYVRGDNLYDVLRKGPMPVARALTIMRQVLAGLGHAHQQGIVHRDVKPDNVILADAEGTGDHAHLFDFGLAKLTGGGGENTSPAAAYAIGTPSYMSPEQARGEPVDVRSDVYACGVLLFEMLTGRKPFRGDNSRDVLRHHVKTPPPTLAEAAPDRTFSPELEAVVARALAKDPAERPADALAFAEELEPLALRA
ncbi:MAG: serine/threonine protein kinase, partial [Myxococcales bacterium]|nr:serine/threonine protein kinase [Myxococcales bacterium]